MASLFMNRGRRLLYFSSIYGSAFLSSWTSNVSSTSMFDNYLKQSYEDNLNETYPNEQSAENQNICKILTKFDCQRLFPMKDAIRIQAEAFLSMHNETTIVPPRIIMKIEENSQSNADDTLFKPSYNEHIIGQKVVSVRPNNPILYELPSITGCIILWNRANGLTECMMDAQFITARRTAAGSGLATDLFATSELKVLTVFGAGNQSLEHIRSILTVRNLPKSIFLINRSLDKAMALKERLMNEINGKTEIVCIGLDDFQQNEHEKYLSVISEADVICTCTASEEPLFDGRLCKKNVHINAVGAYKPNMRELDENVIEQSRVFIDSEHAFGAGDLCNYLDKIKCDEIGQFICNQSEEFGNKEVGKPIDEMYENEMTLFKSVGVAAQDLHSAYFVYQNAKDQNIGTNVYV